MSLHRVFVDAIVLEPGAVIAVEGEEARHAAAVKRVEVGEAVELLDGAGTVARGEVVSVEGGKKAALSVRVVEAVRKEAARPAVHVWSATPKGDRADWLIEQLSQVGAASWSPLSTRRGVVDPRDAKLERLQRAAVEAMKQCGRAHCLAIRPARTLDDLLRWMGNGEGRVALCADASGTPPGRVEAGEVLLLVGPEGGWDPEEMDLLRATGVGTVCFGPHVMRIETAAVVGAGTLVALSCGK